MRSRFMLLAVALPVLAAAPVNAQTIFRATGGDVIFTPVSLTNSPFQIFLDAVGNSHRLIAFGDGTLFTLVSRGSVALSSFNTLGALDLGFFSAGAGLAFTVDYGGGDTHSTTSQYNVNGGVVSAQYVSGTGTFVSGEHSVTFTLNGISSIEHGGCTVADPLVRCTDFPVTAVTPTPEPGTIALFATGLAGLIPVAIRRRRKAQR